MLRNIDMTHFYKLVFGCNRVLKRFPFILNEKEIGKPERFSNFVSERENL